MLFRRRSLAWLAGLLALLLLLALPPVRRALVVFDVRVLHEGLKDWRARLTGAEDWRLAPVPQEADQAWLTAAGQPPRIAHALGASRTADANTLPAFERAARAGLRVMEVDLWLDRDGRLRCHHGPLDPVPWRAGDCTFDTLLPLAVASGVYLVLDLKTAFEATGDRVLAAIPDDAAARHVVFQLYAPAHAARWAAWRQGRALAAPMVTAYKSPRSVNHIAAGAAAAGLHAFTLPVERMAALTVRPPGLRIFVHPAHDCGTVRAAHVIGIDGTFVLSGTRCPMSLTP